MQQIKFSIIIPVYNCETYIDAAVESVLVQSESNYEIILVDDGSSDNSGEKCDRWAKRHKCIHVYHQNNMGQIAAREAGIIHACGEYVVFLDADDYLSSHALSVLSDEIVRSHPDCIIFGFQKVDGRRLGQKYCDSKRIVVENPDEWVRKICCESSYNSLCRKAIKRTVTLGNDYTKLLHLRHGEDLVQSLIILLKCRRVVFLDSILYFYRMVSTSVSHTKDIMNFGDSFAARESVYSILCDCVWVSDYTMKVYKDYCTKKYAEVVLNILMLNIPMKCIKKLLIELKSLPWNKMYISKPLELRHLALVERFVMMMFENGIMSPLIFLSLVKKASRKFINTSGNS